MKALRCGYTTGACAAACGRRGLDVYIVNITHPALRIPAVYAIMPGAHFRERAAGGNAPLFAAKLAANLLIGEALGTYSSFAIASPLLAMWKTREPKWAALESRYGAGSATVTAAGE